jgi:hypothetical protein
VSRGVARLPTFLRLGEALELDPLGLAPVASSFSFPRVSVPMLAPFEDVHPCSLVYS